MLFLCYFLVEWQVSVETVWLQVAMRGWERRNRIRTLYAIRLDVRRENANLKCYDAFMSESLVTTLPPHMLIFPLLFFRKM